MSTMRSKCVSFVPQRIVAGIEELDLGAEHAAARSASSLRPALSRPCVAPAPSRQTGSAALTKGKADDLDAIAVFCISAIAPPARQTNRRDGR